MNTEKRIRKILTKYGIQSNIIERYLNEVFTYDNISAYKNMSDDDITKEFDIWLDEEFDVWLEE